MEDILTQKLEVNEVCEKFIRKACRQYNVIAVLLVVFSITTVTAQLISFFKYKDQHFEKWVNIFNFRVYPFIVISQLILALLQLVYFFKGVRSQKKAIEESTQVLFEEGFKFYTYGNTISIVIAFVVIFYGLIFLYQGIYPMG